MASNSSSLVLCLLLAVSISSVTSDHSPYESYLHCLTSHSPPSANLSQLLFTPNSSSYSSLLSTFIQNLRFTSPTTPKPLIIIAPTDVPFVQTSVLCSKTHNLPIRVRSGGHDYEGLSYRSFKDDPFVMIDMSKLRSVSVDTVQRTAWVQSGATIGELSYRIAEKSTSLGYPVGDCPTVAIGGYISGGGIGTMSRKHGLAADNVLDAQIVDANGRILDRESMGEDLFWAIRGGGGSSFGIIVSWKVMLVSVPPTVTVFTVNKPLGQVAVGLVDRWQYVAPKIDENLFIKVEIRSTGTAFISLYLGCCSELLQLMSQSFPELGLERSDCREMNWVQSVLYFSGYTNGEPVEVMIDRSRGAQPKAYVKGKSDYVKNPIPRPMWERIWERILEEGTGVLFMYPHGGRMSEIPESATPYPNREGNLYLIQYLVSWERGGGNASQHVGWIRSLYKEMGPYVSKNPRAAYLNFRDLDLGRNDECKEVNYSKAKVWGRKYFKSNFERLARVKGEVDGENFYRFEQSIPPLVAQKAEELQGWMLAVGFGPRVTADQMHAMDGKN